MNIVADSRRKSTSSAKLKVFCQKEGLHIWKEHYKNLFGNPPEITDKPIQKITRHQNRTIFGRIT